VPAVPATAVRPAARLVEVADAVFAYVQHDGGWWVNTTGFVVGRRQVLAIDSCATEERTTALLSVIGQTSTAPVRTLVNTHHHGDHTHGNYLFEDAVVVGHDECRTGVLDDSVLDGLPPVFEPMPRWGAVRKAPPTLTFADRLTLWLDDLEVDVRHAGAPAHTHGDAVVWIPERDVLFTGDLAFNGGTPLLVSGSVTGYLRALEVVAGINATTVVPGHGAPCGPEIFAVLAGYAELVLRTAVGARAAGLTPLEAARETDLGDFAALHDPERLVLNLHRAYLDLAGGGDLDYAAAFADAVAYNGGRRLRCTA
jgi:cyclase